MINPWQKIFSDHVVWFCNKRSTSKRERYKEAIDLIIEKKEVKYLQINVQQWNYLASDEISVNDV